MLKKKSKLFIAKWRRDPEAIDKFKFVHHFLPHPESKKRASLLSATALSTYIVLIIIIMSIFRIIPMFLPGVLGYASNINVIDLLKYTNEERKEKGLDVLYLNPKLSEAAKKKAMDMFKDDYWAHVSPGGTEPWDFILSEDYDYTYAGENLAKNFYSSNEVVKAWMESPTHKENLLGKNYQEVGFAVVNGVLNGYETTLVVQMFGKPRDASLLASKQQEEEYIRQISNEAVSTVALNENEKENEVVKVEEQQPSEILPVVDVNTASKGISVAFGGFVLGLVSLDIWYSRKKGILKLTGHNLAHFMLLLFVIVSIWFVLQPGKIL